LTLFLVEPGMIGSQILHSKEKKLGAFSNTSLQHHQTQQGSCTAQQQQVGRPAACQLEAVFWFVLCCTNNTEEGFVVTPTLVCLQTQYGAQAIKSGCKSADSTTDDLPCWEDVQRSAPQPYHVLPPHTHTHTHVSRIKTL